MNLLLVCVLLCGTASNAFYAPARRRGTTTTSLHGLLGRFRKKRVVEQVKTIGKGDLLPEGDVEVLKRGVEEGAIDYATESVSNLLGTGKALLVGMPGAFTPTCTAQHLPGYVKNVDQFSNVGIDKIAVITTNDRYVNEQWGSQLGALASSDLLVLSDGDGDYVKSLGLADDMGFGVGVRSKRFVVVLQDGKVENVVVDEGMNDCSVTSAEEILKLVTPPPPPAVKEDTATGMGFNVIVVAAAAAAAAALFATSNIMPSVDTPSPSASRVERVNSSSGFAKESARFSLLDEFKP